MVAALVIFTAQEFAGKIGYRLLVDHEHVHLPRHDKQPANLVKPVLDDVLGVLLETGLNAVAHDVHKKAKV